MIGGGGPVASGAASDGEAPAEEEHDGAESGSWFAGVKRRLRATTRKQRVWAVLAVVAVAALVAGWSWIDIEAFNEHAKEWPAAIVAVLVGVLPLAGFPVSALHLAAGLRFEFWPALLVVGLTTLFQHAAAWGLVHALPDRYFARLDPWRDKLAGAGHREAAVLCCLIPGMPYTVQMYLLPVMGVSLRIICLISAPLHTARAVVTILLGNLSDELTTARVLGLAAYYLTIFVACGYTLRRMRRSLAVRRAGRNPDDSSGAQPMGARGGTE